MLTLVWLRRLGPYLAALVIIGLLTGGAARWLHARDARVHRDGVLSVLVPAAQVESITVVRWDTLVVHDTVHLTHWLTKYDTARVVLNVHDTVAVRAFVATADSTVRACRQSVLDLLSSCQAKDTLIATQGRIIAAYRVAPGSPVAGGASWRERALWAGLGTLAGHYVR